MDLVESYKEIDEENRLQSTLARRVEYLTTIEILKKYCFGKESCIDIGCGVGIYSLYLDKMGIKTTAIDLVEDHIKRLKEIIRQTNADIEVHIGDATDLSMFASGSYDVVLCLGPLYHILSPQKRELCISECKRLVRMNGVMIFSYISPYSVFPCVIRGDKNRISQELVDIILDDHRIGSDSPFCFWTDNYYYDPEEIEFFLISNGLEVIDHLASDGQSIAFQNVVNQMTEDQFEVWMNYHLKTCRTKSMLGSSNHGLIVARKKV